MKRLFVFVVMAVMALGAFADQFYIEDFTIMPGETRAVSILLDNEMPYTAFQCDLQLPGGLSVDEDSFALTSRKSSNHTLTVSEFPGMFYRLMSYSLNLKNYSGNSGALVTFNITASDDFSSPQILAIRNTVFTTEEGVESSFANEECRVVLKGDVNMDGFITITDVTVLINMLLSGNVTSPAANVNEDSMVSITDVTVLINLLLSKGH